ncbi:hypothetical protein TrCOL_g7155 [Triparma columacea]|uniref:SH2 domain-containing protein n=1 Tax=Triparma columacea TaxID=722753 RepID=A0A9W7GLH5_9STRA|nr:hypothetical protein TrCOL_g7155 [Triparma columacea]
MEGQLHTPTVNTRAISLSLDYSCAPCTADSLVSTVSSPSLKILHYSGHGTADFLTLENDDGSTGTVEFDHLREMLVRRGGGLELVFVAACQSEVIARAFVDAAVPHVVAVTETEFVLDSNARVFATTFYAGIVGGQTVREAFDSARDRVKMATEEMLLTGRGGEGMFKLMGNGDHDNNVIFPENLKGAEVLSAGGGKYLPKSSLLNDVSPPHTPSSAPPPPSGTISHLYTVHSIYSALATSLTEVDSPRLVTVKGSSGIGKSHLCLVALRHLSVRGGKFGTHQDLTILCTARDSLFSKVEGGGNRKDERGSLGEAVVNVQPMDRYNAAKMLVARTEREFQKRELHGGIFVSEDMDGLDPVSALGESNIISALSGIPSVISEVAGALDNLNLVTDEGKIVNIVIPKAKSGNRCRGVWKSAVGRVGVGWGKWKDVSDWLAKDFRETVGGPRGMTEKCLEFVGGKFAVMKKEGRIVEEEVFFGRLWTWWRGAVAAAGRCGGLWGKKVGISSVDSAVYGGEGAEGFYAQAGTSRWAVGGFLGREEAERLLSGCPAGTFVIRLSSEVGCLAITYISLSGAAVSVLVKPARDVAAGWEMGGGGGGRYVSLSELVMDVEELKIVHPGVRKEDIF